MTGDWQLDRNKDLVNTQATLQLPITNYQFQRSAIGDYIIMIDPQIQGVEPMISFLYQKIKLSRSQNRIAKVKMPAIAQDA
ncbi:hypothetical protein H6G17_19385 [Chroococcidiopsis sp. FACHB-1243]|uniref:hypothetical protein n=1 Tax=Chroococcidiopsis sp. [FACHB-1243] TaxID=2692781 RepID=UPI00177E6502|nr:hypothetical protein [Chroococcidiopsis sp. [FACHB-1243]]MBD2307633.1 hypothetical protein [Chroococcidiopsis sp. [FACHB-1243]]